MNNKKYIKIIFIIIIILFVLLIVLFSIITCLQYLEESTTSNNDFPIDIAIDYTNNSKKTVKEIIENASSVYIDRTGSIFPKIYVNFKYDLYDDNGNSMQKYFNNLVEELVSVIDESFYLIDEEKKIEIYVVYNKSKDTYKIKINELEDFYEETNGEDYTNIKNSEIVKESDFMLTNPMMMLLVNNNMYYANTEFADTNRVQLENGYYSYNNGTMYAKLLGGRVINAIFTKKYTEEIAFQTKVGTSLSEVNDSFSNLSFGSVKDGYLGYRALNYYVFIYNDQISIYEYNYQPNLFFDEYLLDYCETGDLQKLYEDFTEGWTDYFEEEYNPEIGRLKLSFPTRGIDIDINNNDSKGIKIYSNYYLTDNVKELIKAHKITLKNNDDLIHLTEIQRYKTMK